MLLDVHQQVIVHLVSKQEARVAFDYYLSLTIYSCDYFVVDPNFLYCVIIIAP